MYCPKCGRQQPSDDVRFCTRCGLSLRAVANLVSADGAPPNTAEMIRPFSVAEGTAELLEQDSGALGG